MDCDDSGVSDDSGASRLLFLALGSLVMVGGERYCSCWSGGHDFAGEARLAEVNVVAALIGVLEPVALEQDDVLALMAASVVLAPVLFLSAVVSAAEKVSVVAAAVGESAVGESAVDEASVAASAAVLVVFAAEA